MTLVLLTVVNNERTKEKWSGYWFIWIIRVGGKENWELHKLDIWPFSFLLIWNKAENSDLSCCSCFASTSDQISLSFLRKCETLTVKTFNLTIRTWILPPLPLQIPGHSIHLLHKWVYCLIMFLFLTASLID